MIEINNKCGYKWRGRLSAKAFADAGYLQEANRLFFHPLGLALRVTVVLGGEDFVDVVDFRDDPEGVAFMEDAIDREKVRRVNAEKVKRSRGRMNRFGGVVQPWRTKEGGDES